VNQQLREMGKEELQETFSSVYKSDGTQYCDESDYIDLLAKKLNVNSNQIEPKEIDVPSELEKIIWHMENPPESTLMSSWHTFKKVREKKVVVTLDGQGADEQLAGYLNHVRVHLTSLTLFDFYKEFRHFLKIPGAKKDICIAFLMNHFKFIFGERLLKKFVKKVNGIDLELNLNKKLANDLNTSLITLIHYADHTSMGHSIESRMPFMDYRLVEFLASVPATYKMHNGWTKYLARLAFNKKLPNEICWRKDKLGWPIPENFWLRGGLKNWFIQRVTSSPILLKLSLKKNFESDINSKKNVAVLIRYLNISIFNQQFFSNKND
jgi:asparagine synthase (glutamine-hydrolysing)